jgi:hypothetical protein
VLHLLTPPNADEMEKTQGEMLLTQRVVQVCLFLFTAIGLFGGTVQMYLGEPETTPRLDNIHRFMAGIYLTTGIISLWAAMTIRKQNTLVFLLALGGLMGAIGRLISMNIVGLPTPSGRWLTYLSSEIIIPLIIIGAQMITNRKLKANS